MTVTQSMPIDSVGAEMHMATANHSQYHYK
ncbi:hypothetical protein IL54_3715 [Sphingobium sp. ba1]|nr:hypothetical protein IL54_3715 [Sphingobium sp. ba1]